MTIRCHNNVSTKAPTDDPNEVNNLLQRECSLSMNYNEVRNLASYYQQNEQTSPMQKQIDDLLSRDLLQLSMQDRNAIIEEIHGVHNLALKESPSIILQALINLQACIDKLPKDSKAAYLQSQDLVPNTYINSSEFRLRFLRCELFDAKKAASRMTVFLDLLKDVFGDYALKRPVQLSDFSWEDMQVFRTGNYQLLPYRDRSGRRIFATVGGFAAETSLMSRVRILLYLMLVASEDEETQRKGIASIVWPGLKFKAQKESRAIKLNRLIFMKRVYENLPVRTCCIHFCLPNSPFANVFKTCFLVTMSSLRKRMKFHTGENVEIAYALKGFGIPVENIPLTDTGNIKTIYLKQWMKLRKAFDAIDENDRKKNEFPAIECPRSTDVCFRSGTSMSCHPGNVQFRCLLESFTCPMASSALAPLKTTQAELAEHLIQKIRGAGGRFLKWENKGYWYEITDELHVHNKVALAIRDFKYRSKVLRMNRQNSQSYTFMFLQNGNKRKREEQKFDEVNTMRARGE